MTDPVQGAGDERWQLSLRHRTGQQVLRWMINIEILCTLSYMACISTLFRRTNTVF